MKKNNLTIGILFSILGGILLLIALLTKGKLNSLLVGFSCSYSISGILMIGKYFYWSVPKNQEQYQERIANETIEFHDELNIKLRDKSGRCAYVFGLVIISISIVVFSVLGALDLLDSRIIVLFLGGYLVVQYIAGILFFNYFRRQY